MARSVAIVPIGISEVSLDNVGFVGRPAKTRIGYLGVDLDTAPVFIQVAADSVIFKGECAIWANKAAATGAITMGEKLIRFR